MIIKIEIKNRLKIIEVPIMKNRLYYNLERPRRQSKARCGAERERERDPSTRTFGSVRGKEREEFSAGFNPKILFFVKSKSCC